MSLLQQLFRSQNPGLAAAAAAATSAASAAAAAGAAPPGAPNGTMQASQQQQQQQMQMAAASQQFLAQQNAAYAAQQAAPYVINPGQEATPYLGMIAAAQMPPYYNVAPWGMYPGNLIPQQSTQPRRPLTPSQQGAENQPYQVSTIEGRAKGRCINSVYRAYRGAFCKILCKLFVHIERI